MSHRRVSEGAKEEEGPIAACLVQHLPGATSTERSPEPQSTSPGSRHVTAVSQVPLRKTWHFYDFQFLCQNQASRHQGRCQHPFLQLTGWPSLVKSVLSGTQRRALAGGFFLSSLPFPLAGIILPPKPETRVSLLLLPFCISTKGCASFRPPLGWSERVSSRCPMLLQG